MCRGESAKICRIFPLLDSANNVGMDAQSEGDEPPEFLRQLIAEKASEQLRMRQLLEERRLLVLQFRHGVQGFRRDIDACWAALGADRRRQAPGADRERSG